MRICLRASLSTLAVAAACSGCLSDAAAQIQLGNPYEKVNWQTFSLHVHTLQSDGCHLLDEVVRAYQQAGFSILSITDHDAAPPNRCPTRDIARPAAIAAGAFAERPTPYPDPAPGSFSANTTWPWSDFGAPSPSDLGMLGIEGGELTCGFHVSSFFNDYGVPPPCSDDAPALDEQLLEVARRGGLASLNHPFRVNESLGWYVNFYREHSVDYLVGLELAGDGPADVDYSVALWDQLLSHLMPSRPLWGFGTSDTHLLVRTRFAFTVFLLDKLTTENVKEAMRSGQFYSVVGPRIVNLSRERGQGYDGQTAYDRTYPELRSIAVDRHAGEISIDAAGYDEIVWISQRPWSEPRGDDAGSWPSGEVVQRGPAFDYSDSDATLPYVRAELIRHTDNGPIRLFINPFAVIHP